ncbi:MAG: tRNA (adenosine(37)-N6)-threonylcarbamoyltransferase complex dimerization subunit type 1 TsaB [Alphaproteobacteria bacterium]|nr:tRNA (adenosine(37)-N6)-threonylcarbamoyltransferase complex dimerization subunit type 1 TsaB [Alphaproteobacteria bacterium]
MLLLALDTSANFVSVALVNEDRTCAYLEEEMERGQAEALMTLIENVLKKAQKTMADIDGVAVTVGPGSFTGVRIGLAAARAFGLALKVPVYGVTCFEAWAYHLGRDCMVVLDSKRDDYFVQSFNVDGNPTSNPEILSADVLKTKLPFLAVGTGAQALSDEIGCQAVVKISPIAVATARIALTRLKNPMPPKPLYMREADVTV